jgi:hypothetical protein
VSNANYLIEIPALKGHRWAGVTFFAKNFFGCNTRFSASHMHAGTMRLDYGSPIRSNYKQYRVFVDLLGSKQLGGKTLLFLMDGLWRTSEEHTPPTKFLSSPFNNSYSSSVFASLDPVAIESVCLDVLQKEFTEDDSTVYPVRNSFVQWAGIDDYLHQAASSDWWPNSISYDPDNTGTPIGSLGTHEHWNNTNDMQYSRNLGTGNGIELVTNFATTDIHSTNIATEGNVSPNPCSGNAAVSFNLASGSDVTIILVSATGAIVGTSHHSNLKSGQHKLPLNISGLKSGNYFCVIKPGNQTDRINTIKFVVRPM